MKTDQDVRYSVVELCWALGVSRSGFYDHEQKPDGERRREDGVLAQKISVLFLAGRCTYGWRRIQKGLLREGIACGKGRIVRLMRDLELEVIQKRVFRPKTTQSRHDQPIAPNRLKELPEPPQKPNEVWCADITYIPSQQEGWLYLAGELDLCSRRLAGWKLDTIRSRSIAIMPRRCFLITLKPFIILSACILPWGTCLHWRLKSNFSPKNWQLLLS